MFFLHWRGLKDLPSQGRNNQRHPISFIDWDISNVTNFLILAFITPLTNYSNVAWFVFRRASSLKSCNPMSPALSTDGQHELSSAVFDTKCSGTVS